MRFCVLGPLEVLGDGGEPLALGSPRQRAVLGVLLAEANRVVAVDRILDLLWRGEPPGQATATLQTYISGLRRALEPERAPRARPSVVVTRAPGYAVVVAQGGLDAAEFEALAAQGRTLVEGDPRLATELLDRALALWRGAAYADFADEPWALGERSRLEELRLGCVEARFDAQLALGQHTAIVSELLRFVDDHPLRERARGQLMLALYRSGRHVEALRAFEEGRTRLAEDLGLEPGPELRRLERAILEHDDDLVAAPVVTAGPADTATVETDRPVAPSLDEPSSDAAPPAPSWEPEFIGRTRELEEVRRAIAGAETGSGAVVVIEGEPGCGKSRLLGEIAARVRDEGGVVLSGRGLAGDSGPPLWPWPNLVRDALAEVPEAVGAPGPGDGARDEIRAWAASGDVGAGGGASPALARGRLFENVARLLTEVAACRWPVLLAVDDLDRCGDDALELLVNVARTSDRSRLLVVVALPTPGPATRPAVVATLAALAAIPRGIRLALGHFDREETASCVLSTTGSAPSDDLVDRVYERTGGNPFFTVEVGRLLATGVHGLEAIPESIRDVVRHRLERLPIATRQLLEVAALAGRRFELPVIAQAAGQAIGEAAVLLEPAEAAGVVVPDDELGAYRFSHGVVAEVVAAELGRLPRARVHDTLAAALAERWEGGDPAGAAEIADHAGAALPVGAPARALEWTIVAARTATQALALGEAERFHRRRIEVVGFLPAGPEAWRAELEARSDLAVLLTWRRGQAGKAVGAELARSMELARRLGDVPATARAAWGLWTHHSVRGELERAAETARLLQEVGRQTDDPMYQAMGDVAAGATAYQQGRHADARAALDRAGDALGVVEERGLADELVQHPAVHRAVFDAMVEWLAGDEDAGTEALHAAVDAASALGHPYTEQFARSFAVLQSALRDDVEGTLETAAALLVVTREQGFAYTATLAAAALGWARGMRGDHDGVGQLQDAMAERVELEADIGRPILFALLAEALLFQGRAEEALRACDEGLAAAEVSTERYWVPELHRDRARALEALGRGTEAEDARGQAVAVARAQGARTLLRRAGE